jgi:hypothetical protein
MSGLKKLGDWSAPMVFIGYSEGAKAYRLMDPLTKWVHTSRDVIFDESRGGIGARRQAAASRWHDRSS